MASREKAHKMQATRAVLQLPARLPLTLWSVDRRLHVDRHVDSKVPAMSGPGHEGNVRSVSQEHTSGS